MLFRSEIRSAGASTRLLLDGDVAGGIQAAMQGNRIDLCVGIGGSPEGIATTCAIKALGGFIQGILHPRNQEEEQRALAAGLKLDYVYEADEMVKSENTLFVATGITDGSLLSGVRRRGTVIETDSIILRSVTGTIRQIKSEYQIGK